MSFANFINKNSNNNQTPEINFGDIELDMDDIDCETLVVNKSISAPQIDDISSEITNIKADIQLLRTEIAVFKNDVIEQINKILVALNIDSENNKITTTYDMEVKGNFTQG